MLSELRLPPTPSPYCSSRFQWLSRSLPSQASKLPTHFCPVARCLPPCASPDPNFHSVLSEPSPSYQLASFAPILHHLSTPIFAPAIAHYHHNHLLLLSSHPLI